MPGTPAGAPAGATPGDAAYTPSAHVQGIADSFIGTQYDDYATDMLVNRPDFVVYTPKGDNRILGAVYNDHFQVFDKPDGKLLAAWAQATKEGDVDQHIAFSRSTDKGLSWEDPVVLAGSPKSL